MSTNAMSDEDALLGTKSPIKRLGSTRKILFFNSKFSALFFSELMLINNLDWIH